MCRKSVSMNYPPTRKTLLEKIKNGDEIYWNEFYSRYAPVIKYVGRLYIHSCIACCKIKAIQKKNMLTFS